MKDSNYWGTPHTNPRMPFDGMDERKKKPKPKPKIPAKPTKNARAKKIKKETKYTAWSVDGLKNPEIVSWSCSFADYESSDDGWRYSEPKVMNSGGLTQQYETAKNKNNFTYLPGAFGIKVKGANIYNRMNQVISDLKGYSNLQPPFTIGNLTLRMNFDSKTWDMNIYTDSKGKIVWTVGANGRKPRQMQWKAVKNKLTSWGFTESFAKKIIDASNSGWGQITSDIKEAKGFIQACKNNAPPPGDLPYSAAVEALDLATQELWDNWVDFVGNCHEFGNWETDSASPEYMKDIESSKNGVKPYFAEVEKILGVIEEFHPKNYEVLVAENKSMPSGKPINSALKGTGQGLLKVLEEMKNALDKYEDDAKKQVEIYSKITELQNDLAKESAVLADLIGEGYYGVFRGAKGGEGFLTRGQFSYESNRAYPQYASPYSVQVEKSLEVKND
jgi:hypothetical protein